jgi:hypothetical protein
MKFNTVYNYPTTVPAASGSRTLPKFVRRVDDQGRKILVQDGLEDIYGGIQQAAKGVEVADLVRRFRSGDTDAIGDPSFDSVDITTAPTSLLDAQNKLIKAREQFDALPVKVKQQYNNDASFWLAKVASGEFVKNTLDEYTVSRETKALKDADEVAKLAQQLSSDDISKLKTAIAGGKL